MMRGIPFFGLCIVVLGLPWALGGLAPFAPVVADCIVGLCLILSLVVGGVNRRVPGLVWASILLLLYASIPVILGATGWEVSGFPQICPPQTMERLAGLVMPVGVLLLAYMTFNSPSRIETAIGLVAINGMALCFLGLAQRLSWNGKILWIYELIEGGLPFATWVNRNNAGGWFLMALASSLFFLVRESIRNAPGQSEKSKYFKESFIVRGVRSMGQAFSELDARQLYVVAGFGLLIVGVVASLSRGATIGLVVLLSIAFVAGFAQRRAMAITLMLAIGIALSVVVWAEQLDTVAQRAETLLEVEEVATPRLVHWRDSLPLLGQYWLFGSGLGTWRLIYPPYDSMPFIKWFQHAENQYLELFCELGIAGALYVLLALGLSFRLAIQLLRRPEATGRALGVMIMAIVGSQAVVASVDFGLFLPANSCQLAMLIGAGLGYQSYGQRMAQIASQAKSSGLAIPLWGLATLLGLTLLGVARIEQAVGHRLLAVRGLASLKPDSPVSRLESIEENLANAVRIFPSEPFNHFEFGRYWVARYRLEQRDRLTASPEWMEQILEDQTTQSTSSSPQSLDSTVDSAEAKEVNPTTLAMTEITAEDRAKAIWTASSLEWYHESLCQELEGLAEAERIELTANSNPAVLAQALVEYRLADQVCPRVSRFRIARAPLEFLATGNPEIEQELIDQALELCPNDCYSLFEGGLYLAQQGSQEAAARLWGKCLALTRKFDREVFEGSQNHLTLGQFLDRVLPKDPVLLLHFAKIQFNHESEQLLKQMLLDHTIKVIQANDVDVQTKTAWMAEANFLAGRFESSVKEYELLLQLQPGRVDWRTQYAIALGNIGELERAIEQLTLSDHSPTANHRLIERYLRQFKRARREQL